MPPKKRGDIGQRQSKAKKVKLIRYDESVKEREDQLAREPKVISFSRTIEASNIPQVELTDLSDTATKSRAKETLGQREARLTADRNRAATTRAAEASERKKNRLTALRDRAAISRAAETSEHREARLTANRNRAAISRAAETSEQREARRTALRDRAAISIAAETSEQREARRTALRDRAAISIAAETSEQREARCTALRDRAAISKAAETSEQREARRTARRDRGATSRAAETSEQRCIRLHDLREKIRKSRETNNLTLLVEGFNYDPHKDYAQHPNVAIGIMETICSYCRAKKFKSEPPGMCCRSGKVKLPQLESPPDELMHYMSGDTLESKHFLRNIRRYNSCFHMTSFGATSIVDQPGFAPTFTIQGQVYHRVGSLLPSHDQNHNFIQLYFIGDDHLQTEQRCETISETRREIVLNLQKMFHKHNHLIQIFKTALERMPTDDYKVVIKADRIPIGEHERRFNAPTVDEVAVVMSVEEFDQRDIIIQRRSHTLQRISETHRCYDALQYPIIFPRGEDGYHFNLKQIKAVSGETTNKKVSSMDFYAYRLMVRETEPNHILNCRQLFHQFAVDMYAKIESERLLFIRLNQKKLRSEEYIHLRDAVANDGNVQDIGSMVILPSTFTGSPRYMHEYTQDAMTYVRNYGRPDLFITFTCNPAWVEIREMLINGQSPSDRPDLITRVFRQKQIKLIDIITKEHVFGVVKCWMYTIEFQKRGLPHSHNLIWLKEKIQPTQIDDIIRAELPDPIEDPILYEIIAKNMIHGPCGHLNPNSPCMRDGKCSKKYPRELLKDTQTGEDGYPRYRRRAPENGGYTMKMKIRGNEVEVDNRWVVPHSPLLSKIFQAHINVEYCNSVKSIKYVCKYINKGSDMAVYSINKENTNNEVIQFQLGRYISGNDAVWRILGFPIRERHPTVVHLSVHLENGQRVYFTPQNALQIATQPPNTTLTAFFKLCREDSFARTLLYPEVPRYYTWNSAKKIFCKRIIGKIVPEQDAVVSDALGRVYTVHPNNAECFFLRLLLHTVRGPTSFTALKTVNGEEFNTYREVCLKLGLLEEDQHWGNAMREAELISSPDQIRTLFAIILTVCNPANPNSLWEQYREAMSEDILATVRKSTSNMDLTFSSDIFNKALIIIEDKCIAMTNNTLNQLGLKSPARDHKDILNADYMRERNYNIQELHAYIKTNKPFLNQDQINAYNIIMDHVKKEQGGIIFLDAPAGTGKTFLTNLILAKIRSLDEVALAVASSGIAATLMNGGRTAHSALKLPLDIDTQQNPTCNIGKTSGRAQVLKACKIIIWDECTMAHKKCLEALDTTLKDFRGNNQIMGGVLVLLCGDFRQTLPVLPKSTPADEINACLKHSALWKNVKKISLTENMRVVSGNKSSKEFADKLLKLGEGRLPTDTSGMIKLPPHFCKIVTSVSELIDSVYPDIFRNFLNQSWLFERTILAAKNNDVYHMNNIIINMIPGPITEYKSIDTVVEVDQAVNFPPEFLNSLQPSGLPPHHLRLKAGCPIILLRNIDPPRLCNGTRLCLKKLLANVLEATILSGVGMGETVFIPRVPLIPTDLPFNFKRLQFPVQLAFCISINKSQGQSIHYCGINLNTPCFSHGQLYVACSRVVSPTNLTIFAPDGQTKNIVYRQVLE